MHPGVLVLPNGATRVQSDVFQHAHDKTLRVFHEVRGVEQALIQQIILTTVDETYIIAMKNRGETGQFIGNVLQIFQYLQNTYGTILSSQLSQFEKEVTDMYYDPVTSVDNIFNKIEDLVLEYGDLANCPFSQPQAIAKEYNLLNATGHLGIVYRQFRKHGSTSSNISVTPTLNLLRQQENLPLKKLDSKPGNDACNCS